MSTFDRVLIFDTTLRDGEQAPGASMNETEKLEIAYALERLGVDIIEAGFPVISQGDFNSVKTVAQHIKGAVICGLARSIKEDIDAAYEAIKDALHPRIHVFLATSKIHLQYKFKKTPEEILQMAVEAVKYAKKKMSDIEFSPEDASRSEKEFLYRILEAVIEAGATTVNIPDTVGYSTPTEYGRLIADIRNHVPNIHQAVISVHCHDDLGLGVANSLSAVQNGARQVECTVNGIGERAGNASLEEMVMAMDTRRDFIDCFTQIRLEEITKTSRLVSHLTGMMVQPNKAIVGRNAFSHESGIHQDGVIKKRITYEIIDPKRVGLTGSQIILGKLSGRHAFSERVQKLGYRLQEVELDRAFERFKKLADQKKYVFDEDIEALIQDEITEIPETWKLEYLKTTLETGRPPRATIRLRRGKEVLEATSQGDGPVDACYKAIEKITKLKATLTHYAIQSVTGGKDAQGEVTVKLQMDAKEITGRGASTDIIEASVKAYLFAVNKVCAKLWGPEPEPSPV